LPSNSATALVLLISILAATPAVADDGPALDEVRGAIARAVAARFGAGATVTVDEMHVRLSPARGAGQLAVHIEPGARVGGLMRFALRWADRRHAGEADAVVRVEAECARARRDLERGTLLAADDFEVARGDVGRGGLRPCPTDLLGSRLLRGLAAGEVVSPQAVSVSPLVRSGDAVVTRVRVPGVEVSGRAVASQSGELGDVIRVVNTESGRALRARVTGRGEVEVIHGS
jgi:flagella basal body P-ring formation protein FlgA